VPLGIFREVDPARVASARHLHAYELMEGLVVDAVVAVAHDRSVDISRDDQAQRIGHLPQGPLHPWGVVVDSQSVKVADTVPKASRGWDNTKKRLPEGHEVMVLWAMVALITKHLATQRP
jgi:hypothetical protein